MTNAPSFFARLSLAFAVLGDSALATKVQDVRNGVVPAAPPAPPAPPPPPVLKIATPDAALQLLGLLQREARFVDFIQEDVAPYTDAEIGAAARVVHEGCRKVLREHFTLSPVRAEAEGSRITLQAGFDAAAVRLTGHVVGEAPFTGTLGHRGWQVTEVKLPQLTDTAAAKVLAQAEVEL